MADLQEQLQAILGDAEAMSQIAAVARALTGGPAPAEEGRRPEPQAQDVEFVPVEGPAPEDGEQKEAGPPGEARPTQGPGTGPAEGPDLSALLGMLGGGSLPDIDPRLLQIALRVFAEYSAQDDEKAALLSALKPFLRAERLEKLEKAERVARLSRVVRVAIRLLKEEGPGDV